MSYYILKIAITAVLIVIVSEVAKRSSFMGSVLASVPLVSVLAMLWLYLDTKDVEKVSSLASSIFWLVLPSLVLFLLLPVLLRMGLNFYLSILLSTVATIACYWLMISVLNYYGIKL